MLANLLLNDSLENKMAGERRKENRRACLVCRQNRSLRGKGLICSIFYFSDRLCTSWPISTYQLATTDCRVAKRCLQSPLTGWHELNTRSTTTLGVPWLVLRHMVKLTQNPSAKGGECVLFNSLLSQEPQIKNHVICHKNIRPSTAASLPGNTKQFIS